MKRRLLSSGMKVGPHRPRRVSQPSEPVEAPTPVEEPEALETEEEPVEEVVEKEEPEEDALPDASSTISTLVDWVGDDASRAQVVLDQEYEKPEKDRRKTLVSKMEEIKSAQDASDLI